MGLFLGKKRRDIRAWEDASFEKTANRFVQPDIALYERLTKAQIENDCRIILESAQIMVHTSDSRVAESRRKLIGERYAHLMTLKPFAERSQRALIKDAVQAYRDFMDACAIFTQVKEPHYYLFVKSGYTKDVQKQAAVDGVKILMIDDLFSIEQ